MSEYAIRDLLERDIHQLTQEVASFFTSLTGQEFTAALNQCEGWGLWLDNQHELFIFERSQMAGVYCRFGLSSMNAEGWSMLCDLGAILPELKPDGLIWKFMHEKIDRLYTLKMEAEIKIDFN